MKLTNNFTLEELIKSETAEKYHLDNTPSEEGIQKLKMLAETILQPIRDELQTPIRISSGYRSTEVNAKVGGVKTSQHCFDQNTEILTNNGWRTIDTIQKWDRPYSYNIEKDIIELDTLKEIIIRPFDGILYYASNQHVEYAVTDEHRMLVRNEVHRYKRKTSTELTEKAKKYFDSLKTENYKYHIELAKDVYKKRRYFKCAGFSDCKNEYDINILRLCMATIADGFLTFKQDRFHGIGFNLVKERDKSELEDILENLGIHYTKRFSTQHLRQGTDNVYTYFINSKNSKEIYEIIGKNKKIPKWFLSLKPEILHQLIITYAKFDGSLNTRKKEHSSITIFSKDEENIDRLQIMCIFCNLRCVKKTFKKMESNIKGCKFTMDKFFHLYITQSRSESRVNEDLHRRFYYNGKVWCISTKNGTVITRRNGKISIQGNCLYEAADLTLGTKNRNKILFSVIYRMIKEGKIKVGQLIDEYNYSWVHVSMPRAKKINNQVLHIR